MRIDLFLGTWSRLRRRATSAFQYPRADRLVFGADAVAVASCQLLRFQYPRADRLVFGGIIWSSALMQTPSFSILVRIDLFLGVVRQPVEAVTAVSVSSCGSTCFWGRRACRRRCRVDRVSVSSCGSTCFWGSALTDTTTQVYARFSILVRIDLFLGAARDSVAVVRTFQYPRADRLVFGGSPMALERHVITS